MVTATGPADFLHLSDTLSVKSSVKRPKVERRRGM
jgi:hypothetical protein